MRKEVIRPFGPSPKIILERIVDHIDHAVEVAGIDRLITINRVSLIQPLPISYRARIAQVPGVTLVTFATFFGGYGGRLVEAMGWVNYFVLALAATVPSMLQPEAMRESPTARHWPGAVI